MPHIARFIRAEGRLLQWVQLPTTDMSRVPHAGRCHGPSVPSGYRRMSTPAASTFGGQITGRSGPWGSSTANGA